MMLSNETSRRLHEAVKEALIEIFGEEEQNFVFILPDHGAMISNVEDPFQIATTCSGVTFSILTGNTTRKMQDAKTGEEVKAN